MITLYKIAATGAVQSWNIDAIGNRLYIEWGQLGGARRVQWEVVEVNKSGRSLEEQLTLRRDSRVKAQLDKGYKYTIEEARGTIGLNASGFVKPMLAQKFRDVANIDYSDVYIQYKYNGHRCLATKVNGEVVLYSRKGKPIPGATHIKVALQNMDEGVTLDGELYIHGMSLQKIGSLARKLQPASCKLQYVIYDVVKDWNYTTRLNYITSFVDNITSMYTTQVVVAPWWGIASAEVNWALEGAIKLGYEGLILRQNKFAYDAGNRSNGLVKIKKCDDAEFTVVDIHASADGWAVLECGVGEQTFRVSAPGTIPEKTEVLKNKDKYIGRLVTVEYFDITDDGIPFHPVATQFREDI